MRDSEIKNKLRKIAKTPTTMFALQNTALLQKLLQSHNYTDVDIDTALLQLSKEDPTFALKYVLEPFIIAFGRFCKNEHQIKRWPTTNEIVEMFNKVHSSRLCPRFIEKRTRKYTIRKLISEIPEWDSNIPKGVRKLSERIQDFSEAVDPYLEFVSNTYVTIEDPRFDLLRQFCIFAFKEIAMPKDDLENIVVESMIKKFKAQYMDDL